MQPVNSSSIIIHTYNSSDYLSYFFIIFQVCSPQSIMLYITLVLTYMYSQEIPQLLDIFLVPD